MTATSHIVAYDDEGGGKAARLLWTLECFGHSRYSLLNAGLHAWANERLPLSRETTLITQGNYHPSPIEECQAVVQRDYILTHLNDSDIVLLVPLTPGVFG